MRDFGSAAAASALSAAAADMPACILALPFWAAVAFLGAMVAGEEGLGDGAIEEKMEALGECAEE